MHFSRFSLSPVASPKLPKIENRAVTSDWMGLMKMTVSAWSKCCRPAELGGLGLSNLRVFGQALRLRWLWFRKTDQDRPWSLLPDQVEPQAEALFHASITVDTQR